MLRELGFLGAHHPEDVGGAAVTGGMLRSLGRVAGQEPLSGPGDGADGRRPIWQRRSSPRLAPMSRKMSSCAPALLANKIAALGVSEPNCGSDVALIRTTARRVGGDFIINGAKCWIIKRHLRRLYHLAVRTGPEGSGFGGIRFRRSRTDAAGLGSRARSRRWATMLPTPPSCRLRTCKIPGALPSAKKTTALPHHDELQGERLIAAVSAGRRGNSSAWTKTIQYQHQVIAQRLVGPS